MTIFFDPKDFGAAGNGVTDDTMAIENAASAARAAGGPVFFRGGTYVLGDPNALSGVDVFGSGGVILAKPGAGLTCLINANGRPGTRIRDVVVDGNRSNGGMALTSPLVYLGSDSQLLNCEVRGSPGYAVWIGGSGPTDNYLIDGCWIHDNGGVPGFNSGLATGIFQVGTIPTNVRIIGCHLTNNHCTTGGAGASSAINIAALGVVIANCTFVDNFNENGGQVAVTDLGQGANDALFVFQGNVVRQTTRFLGDNTGGLEVSCSKAIVASSIFDGCSADGIAFESSGKNLQANGNIVRCAGAGIIAHKYQGTGEGVLSIVGNQILAGAYTGIWADSGLGNINAFGNFIDPSVTQKVVGVAVTYQNYSTI